MQGGKRNNSGRKKIADKKEGFTMYYRQSIIDSHGGIDPPNGNEQALPSCLRLAPESIERSPMGRGSGERAGSGTQCACRPAEEQ